MKIKHWKITEKTGYRIYKCISNKGEIKLFDLTTLMKMENTER